MGSSKSAVLAQGFSKSAWLTLFFMIFSRLTAGRVSAHIFIFVRLMGSGFSKSVVLAQGFSKSAGLTLVSVLQRGPGGVPFHLRQLRRFYNPLGIFSTNGWKSWCAYSHLRMINGV